MEGKSTLEDELKKTYDWLHERFNTSTGIGLVAIARAIVYAVDVWRSKT